MTFPQMPEKHVARSVKIAKILIGWNWPNDAIAGYLAGQVHFGHLRANTPAWLDKTTDFLLAHGAIGLDETFESALEFARANRPAPRKNDIASH